MWGGGLPPVSDLHLPLPSPLLPSPPPSQFCGRRVDVPEVDGAPVYLAPPPSASHPPSPSHPLSPQFCGGRVDAPDGDGAPEYLAPRDIADPVLAAHEEALVLGLTPREAVALQVERNKGGRERTMKQSPCLPVLRSQTACHYLQPCC